MKTKPKLTQHRDEIVIPKQHRTHIPKLTQHRVEPSKHNNIGHQPKTKGKHCINQQSQHYWEQTPNRHKTTIKPQITTTMKNNPKPTRNHHETAIPNNIEKQTQN